MRAPFSNGVTTRLGEEKRRQSVKNVEVTVGNVAKVDAYVESEAAQQVHLTAILAIEEKPIHSLTLDGICIDVAPGDRLQYSWKPRNSAGDFIAREIQHNFAEEQTTLIGEGIVATITNQ